MPEAHKYIDQALLSEQAPDTGELQSAILNPLVATEPLTITELPDRDAHEDPFVGESEGVTESLGNENVLFDAGNLTLPGSTVNTQPLNDSSSLSAPDSVGLEVPVSPYDQYMEKLHKNNISLIYPDDCEKPTTIPEIAVETIIAEVGRSERNAHEYMSSSDAWETLISKYGCTEEMADGLINTLQQSFLEVFISKVHINNSMYYLAIGRDGRTQHDVIDRKEVVSFYGVSFSSKMGNVLSENPAGN